MAMASGLDDPETKGIGAGPVPISTGPSPVGPGSFWLCRVVSWCGLFRNGERQCFPFSWPFFLVGVGESRFFVGKIRFQTSFFWGKGGKADVFFFFWGGGGEKAYCFFFLWGKQKVERDVTDRIFLN